MTLLHAFLPCLASLASITILSGCESTSPTNSSGTTITYIGCTPGDDPIQGVLGIQTGTVVDFIRWNLTLDTTRSTFIADINYGESQPNTQGFKNGGEKRAYSGALVSTDNMTLNSRVYRLTSDQLAGDLSFVKVGANLLHVLTPEYALMVGNGGWSYTLSLKEPVDEVKVQGLRNIPTDTARQMIFDGRTPCQPFAEDYQLDVDASCFKLKWRLILNRDPKTMEPTTYQIQRTNIRETPITGKWIILKGVPPESNTIIYQLDPDKPDASVYFLAGDENVLFVLDKERRLYVGDENFSFTLNRKEPS